MNTSKKILVSLLAVPALAVSSLASAASLITNGGFEDGATGWAGTPTTGFAPITAYGPCCNPTGTYPSGAAAAFFGWGNEVGGKIWQDIPTTPGGTYDVTFQYGAIAPATLQQLLVSALAGPSFTSELGATSVSATGTLNLGAILTDYIFSFTATSAYTRIQFMDMSGNSVNSDGVLDNVSVVETSNPAQVPVPATLALMAVGLGMIGFNSRKKAIAAK